MAVKKYFAAKALVNITHNLEPYKIGETLKLTVDESKELKNRGYVEMIDTLPTETDSNKGDGDGKPNDDDDKVDGVQIGEGGE